MPTLSDRRPRHLAALSLLSMGVVSLFAVSSGCSDPGEDQLAPRTAWPAGDLVAVVLPTEDRAIVASSHGEIHYSDDLGGSWRRARVPAIDGLRSISMGDDQTGWAVGPGVILRTDDAGRSWRRQRLPELESDVRLTSVVAADDLDAVAVGDAGLRLRTRDGGRIWRRSPLSEPAEAALPSWRDVFCLPGDTQKCWSAGTQLQVQPGVDRPWQPVVIAGPRDPAAVAFEPDQVELREARYAELLAFAEALAGRADLEWVLEPAVGASEVELLARQRDPTAVFELIDARLQEVRSVLEVAGVAPGRILSRDAPPWDFEDYLDDDPAYLERYWADRVAAVPSVRIETRVRPDLLAGVIGAEGQGLIVGRSGALVYSEDGGAGWRAGDRPTPNDLHGVAFGRERVVLVGAQGGLWTSKPAARDWSRGELDTQETFFEPLHDVAFSPSGGTGLIVGRGRILRSLDGGRRWSVLIGDAIAGVGAVDTPAQDGHSVGR